jgi:hypothetical protein
VLTPSKISSKPKIAPVMIPEYNFKEQNRWSGFLLMATTSGTKQTFDSFGNPRDNTSDQD